MPVECGDICRQETCTSIKQSNPASLHIEAVNAELLWGPSRTVHLSEVIMRTGDPGQGGGVRAQRSVVTLRKLS